MMTSSKQLGLLACAMSLALALVGCGSSVSPSGSGEQSSGGGSETVVESTPDAGGGGSEGGGAGTNPAPGVESTSDDKGAKTYGEAPTGETSSRSGVSGDASKVPDLPQPAGGSFDMDKVKQAIADATVDVDLPSEVVVGKVSTRTRNTTSGEVVVSSWRYGFGKGDAMVVTEVQYVKGDHMSEPDVVATAEDLRHKSENAPDRSNLLADGAERVDRVYPTVSLGGGTVRVGAVSEGTYALSIGFYASGEKVDQEGSLPTLTVNGVTMVADPVEGAGVDSGDSTRYMQLRYHGDIPVSDKVSVEWCGATSNADVSTSNIGSGLWFDRVASDVADKTEAYKLTTDEIAKSVSGGVALSRNSCAEAMGALE